MSDTVIKVENLSKHYNLGTIGSGTLYRDVQSWWAKLRGKEDPNSQLGTWNADQVDTDSSFWALKDVSFDVKQGDVLGIIGRNGAGKSTLLKILSRVTGPTSGNIKIKGRVASLLEVGTGFHPELTGRENVYLNGTILGMRKAEIDRKFDEIVAFAEIEKFIDTPVKRYSSGMYVRLAFAVAAHLEPEILIVDEVLAVGDAEFQKKCLGKMESVGKEGRTVLLVSHSMTTIQAIATKALYLQKGITDGIIKVEDAVRQYMNIQEETAGARYIAVTEKSKADMIILSARVLDCNYNESGRFKTYEDIYIEMSWSNQCGRPVHANFMLVNGKGQTIMVALDTPSDWDGSKKKEKGIYRSVAKIPKNLLNVSNYVVHVSLDSSSPTFCYEYVLDALCFDVYDSMDEQCITRGAFKKVRDDAILMPALEWKWERVKGE